MLIYKLRSVINKCNLSCIRQIIVIGPHFCSELALRVVPAIIRLTVYSWLHIIPGPMWLAGLLAHAHLWFGSLWVVCAPDSVVRLRWRIACCLIIIYILISTQRHVHPCTRQPRAHFLESEMFFVEFLQDCALRCPWLVLRSLVIPSALRAPLSVTWLTVCRQLQINSGSFTWCLQVIRNASEWSLLI